MSFKHITTIPGLTLDGKPIGGCATCAKTEGELFTCGACEKEIYCSRECQRANEEEHKRYCKESRDGAFLPNENVTYVAVGPDGNGIVRVPFQDVQIKLLQIDDPVEHRFRVRENIHTFSHLLESVKRDPTLWIEASRRQGPSVGLDFLHAVANLVLHSDYLLQVGRVVRYITVE